MVGAGAAGVLTTYLVKNYVPNQTIVALPANLGTTQNLVSLVGGAGAILLSVYAMKTRKIVSSPLNQMALMAFGGSLLTSGLINTFGNTYMGLPAQARAYPRAAVRAVPQGAYQMVSRRETNIL